MTWVSWSGLSLVQILLETASRTCFWALPGTIEATGGTVSIVDPRAGRVTYRRLYWERHADYGSALGVGGDRDADMLTDYATVARSSSGGMIQLLSGNQEEPLATFQATSDCRLFDSVVLDVDANSDGTSDVIAFEYSSAPPCPQEPTVARIFDGATLEMATFPVDRGGFVTMQSTPDYNGDGMRDLLAAFPYANGDEGELQLISGDGEVLQRYSTSEPRGLFGLTFSTCDLVDDTVAFAVGGGVPLGDVVTYVYRLDAAGDVTRLAEGAEVKCAPDMNGDGSSDALVLTDSLRWTVVSGRSGARLVDHFTAEFASSFAIDVGGDVDGDGRADIAAITYGRDPRILIARSSAR